MKKFYIVAHTHWDREWHQTYQENRVRLIKFIDHLCEILNHDQRFNCFILDGQTSLLLDYLEIKPFNQPKLQELIAAGRIIVGPWFVQPDENLPSGESLIRNLLLSKNIAERYGKSMQVGYLPDSFGQSAVMPTVLKGFGIDSALFYRGLTLEDTPYNQFIWRGLDGSEVVAEWMANGYGNGMFLSENLAKSVEEIEKNIKTLGERSVSGDILIMNGSDQCFAKEFLPELCTRLQDFYLSKGKDYQFIISSLEDYMKELAKFKDKLSVLTGEFRKGKHSRTHISIGGTRLDVKRKNFEIERKYQDLLEPLNALLSLSDNQPEQEIINRGWRYIVENHAHDSICTCCKDLVHAEMLMRIESANQIADTLIEERFARLHALINYDQAKGKPIIVFSVALGKTRQLVNVDLYVKNTDFIITDSSGQMTDYVINSKSTINLKDTVVSFSPLPDDYYQKINLDFVAETDGLGYQTYYIVEGKSKPEDKNLLARDHTLENDYIKVEVLKSGVLRITDKINSIVYEQQHIFQEGGNAGDEYDYSPPEQDQVFTSQHCLKSVQLISNSSLKAVIRLKYLLEVPLTTTSQQRSKEVTPIEIVTDLSITAIARQIYFKTRINNTARNHRIQVVFDAGQKLAKHIADLQFGEIERENELELTPESEGPDWNERYYPIYHQHKYCGVVDQQGTGFIIMNKGLPQYEVDNQDTSKLRLTLLSSVGMIGNENLKYRPGRRSGAPYPTPAAQLLGDFETEYSFMPVSAGLDYYNYAQDYVSPRHAVSYPEYECDGVWPDMMTLFKNNDRLTLSAFKCAEDGNGYILRIVNPERIARKDLCLKFNRYMFSGIERVNLAEVTVVDPGVEVGKENNLDGSDRARLSGRLNYKSIERNGIRSHRLYQ